METIKEGAQTSEYKETKKANLWAVIYTVLGIVITAGSSLLPSLGVDSKWGIAGGALIAIFGIVQRTIVTLGYVKGRSDVKASGLGGLNSNK